MEPSGCYYANIRRQGKLIRQSLKTTDLALAKRYLRDKLPKLDRLKAGGGRLTFGDVCSQWLEIELPARAMKPFSRRGKEGHVQSILKALPDLKETQMRSVSRILCRQWFAKRVKECSASCVNHELGTLREIFSFSIREGIILENPADGIKRARIVRKKPSIPDREQFAEIIGLMRREGNDDSADLLELLAYSGMRLNEATSLRWDDVNFKRGVFMVTGGEKGTKNSEFRQAPLFPAVRSLLERIQSRRPQHKPSDTVLEIKTCRTAFYRACRVLRFPRFHHHNLRHFFVSNAVEAGVDFKAIADWVGHKDGGVLVAQVYGHLRQLHSDEMAKRMVFTAAPAEVPSEA